MQSEENQQNTNSILFHEKINEYNKYQNRKIERQLLMLNCKQKLYETDQGNVAQEIKAKNPELSAQLSIKRFIPYKDPSVLQKKNTFSNCQFNYTDCSDKFAKALINKFILQRDKNACNHILNELELEGQADNFRKSWQQAQRSSQKSLNQERKYQKLELERKSGVPFTKNLILNPEQKAEVIPKFKTTKRLDQLSLSDSGKGRKASFPFLHHDFRGLILPDFGDSIKGYNSEVKNTGYPVTSVFSPTPHIFAKERLKFPNQNSIKNSHWTLTGNTSSFPSFKNLENSLTLKSLSSLKRENIQINYDKISREKKETKTTLNEFELHNEGMEPKGGYSRIDLEKAMEKLKFSKK